MARLSRYLRRVTATQSVGIAQWKGCDFRTADRKNCLAINAGQKGGNLTRIDATIPLTARQHEVLSCLARGMTAQEIASELSISARTARMHCDVLRMKLGVSRCRLIPQAYREVTGSDPLLDSA
jgi:DNA-binding CsgD family transcriptional regulator